jgi:hypothetical protein
MWQGARYVWLRCSGVEVVVSGVGRDKGEALTSVKYKRAMTNDEIIVVRRVVATSQSVTWHLRFSSSWCAVDVASAQFVGDVALPHHSLGRHQQTLGRHQQTLDRHQQTLTLTLTPSFGGDVAAGWPSLLCDVALWCCSCGVGAFSGRWGAVCDRCVWW